MTQIKRVVPGEPVWTAEQMNALIDERNKFALALTGIVNVLGPDKICSCRTCEYEGLVCALPEEAAEALRMAKEALK